jgi:flagella basal body P-ring formation protein FlgA
LAAIIAVAALSLALAAPVARAVPAPAAREDVAHLQSLVTSTAAAALGALTPDQHLVVGPLQPSMSLARCTIPVQADIAAGMRIPGRLLVELRCAGVSPWHLYIPVRVVGSANVVVAAHALIAGNVLGAEDLRVERRDLTELPPGYLDDPATAIGLSAARGISTGAILTNQTLLGIKAVQRGQTVTLIARVGGMSVRMSGRALSDGFVNQRVQVENLSSGKTVEGIARSEQIVEIIFQ